MNQARHLWSYLAAAKIGGIALLSGCTLPAARTDCDGGCLPKLNVTAPANAAMVSVQRCVDPVDPDAIQAPNGTYVNHWRELMSSAAQDKNWVIERNEWFNGEEQLGPKGALHLQRIADAFSQQPRMIVIENASFSLKPEESYQEAVARTERLNLNRRSEVVRLLAQYGAGDADPWIILAEDRTVGIRGVEAPIIYGQAFSGGQGTGNRGGIGQGNGQNVGGFGNNGGGNGFGGGLNNGGIF